MTAPDAGARPQRSALLTFTQTILGLQAIAALFVVITVLGLERADALDAPPWFGIAGYLTVFAMMFATGIQRFTWGRVVGTALQVPMLAAGYVSLAITFVGLLFVALWIASLRLGTRIDRERAERLAQ